jgi:betaine-aldehyde dehydrogenase
LFVERPAYQRLLALVTDHARALKVDLPDVPGASMGPISSFRHRERVERFVDQARSQGGDIVTGGARPDDRRLAAGAFYLPTIIAGLGNSADICQQEIFGPVLCVLPFDDEDDLVRQANDTVYGLAAGVWTADYQRAWGLARRIDAGTVWINSYKHLSISTPFGGFKHSGLGREKGIGGMRLYQQTKSLFWGTENPIAARSQIRDRK